MVYRSAAGTVIEPTRTIIHNPNGTATVIVQRRSYLDPGTEVPVGYGSHFDYAFPPGGQAADIALVRPIEPIGTARIARASLSLATASGNHPETANAKE